MNNQVESVLRGSLDHLPSLNSRIVRIFISSTFTDTVEERNALMENIYPKLKKYCKEKHGLEFQVVDMRWGVRDEAADDHTSTDLCIQEILNCQRLSTGPNFVTFLGQKHGHRPIPSDIPAGEFQLIMNCLQSHEMDKDGLLETWYKADQNSVPPIYVLQSISTIIPDYRTKESSKQTWLTTFISLQQKLRYASQALFEEKKMDIDTRHKYFMSVTEAEIMHGILKPSISPHDHCLCFIRIIDDITDNLQHHRVWRFIDMAQSEIDHEAQTMLSELRDHKILKRLQNVNRKHVQWSSNDGINRQDHADYLDKFCQEFYSGMVSLLDKALAAERHASANDLYIEALQHLTMAKERCAMFHGRQDILADIRSYIQNDDSKILVNYGDSGCGKTSVMAKAASLISSWLPKAPKAVVLLRFLGTSLSSSTVQGVMLSLCRQIACNYPQAQQDITDDANELLYAFHKQLKCATKERPLLVFLDSLDQINTGTASLKLNWLPKSLPPYVRFVVSAYSTDKLLLKRLETLTKPENMIHVPVLGESLGMEVLSSWLQSKQKSLTQGQLEIVQTAIRKCSLPLYVKLIFEQVVLWRSYLPVDQCRLMWTVVDTINQLFERIESKHGLLFVTHAFAYLTASQSGLSESELDDLLSLDDTVLTDVFQFHVPPSRRIPSLLWVRLRHDISNYLVDKEADEMQVFYWYHRQFIETAHKRYLSQPQFRKAIHSQIADYFLGIWYNVNKPFTYSPYQVKKLGLSSAQSEAERKISPQPLKYFHETNGKIMIRYNKRKLIQLPYHLTKAERLQHLKEECLCNINFLSTKILATSVQHVLADFKVVPDDPEIALLSKVLGVSRTSLKEYPEALKLEMLGSLGSFVDKAKKKFVVLHKLLDDCLSFDSKSATFLPVQQCYTIPSDALLYTLEHSLIPMGFFLRSNFVVTSLNSQHLIALSEENDVLLWDLATGDFDKQTKLVQSSTKIMDVMWLSYDKQFAVICSSRFKECNHVFVVDINSGELALDVPLKKDYQSIGLSDNVKLDVVHEKLMIMTKNKFSDCFDAHTGNIIHEWNFASDDFNIVKISDRSTLILFHLSQTNVYSVYDTSSFDKLSDITCQNTPLMMQMCSSKALVLSETNPVIEVFNLNSASDAMGKCVQTIDASKHISDKVTNIVVSQDETQMLWTTKDILILWDMQKNKYLRKMEVPEKLKPHAQRVLNFLAFFVSGNVHIAAQYDKYLLLWNKESGKLLYTISTKSRIEAMLPTANGKLLITTASKNNMIKVWNIAGFGDSDHEPMTLSTSCRYVHAAIENDLVVARGVKASEVVVVDAKEGKIISKINDEIMRPAITPDGKYLVFREYSISENTIKVWTTTGKMVTSLPVSSLQLKSYVLSYDSKMVATQSEIDDESHRAEVKIWSISTGACMASFSIDSGLVSMIFAGGDLYLVLLRSSAGSSAMEIFDVKSGTKLGSLPNIQSYHTMQPVVPSGPNVIAFRDCGTNQDDCTYGSHCGELINVNVVTCEVVQTCKHAPVKKLTVSVNGKIAINVERFIFDLDSFECVYQFDDSEAEASQNNAKITQDGKFAVWIIFSKSILKLGDVSTREIISICPIHSVPISLDMTKSDIVVLGCEDGRIMLLNVARAGTKKELASRVKNVTTDKRNETNGHKKAPSKICLLF